MQNLQTQCCIAGGGPAGMMLGYLLARAGVDVTVLEKHEDFLRDFRGDTIHPSTLEVMAELGLLERFLQRPHEKTAKIVGQIGDTTLTFADFSTLSTRCKFIAFMPQCEFLVFRADDCRRLRLDWNAAPRCATCRGSYEDKRTGKRPSEKIRYRLRRRWGG